MKRVVWGLGFFLIFCLASSVALADGVLDGPVCEACSGKAIPVSGPPMIAVDWEDFKDSRLGNCLLPPDYLELNKDWKRFQAVAQLKTSINAKNLAANMAVSPKTRKFMQDLKSIDPVVSDLEIISQSAWFKNLYETKGQIDRNFLKYAGSKAFLDALAGENFTQKQDALFKQAYDYNKDDPAKADPNKAAFTKAVDDLQNNLRQTKVRGILDSLSKSQGISLMDPTQMASYRTFMTFFENKEKGPKGYLVQQMFDSNSPAPLQSDIPLAPFPVDGKAANLFQKEYLNLVDKSIDDYIWRTPVSAEALKPYLERPSLEKPKKGQKPKKEQQSNSAVTGTGTNETWPQLLAALAEKQLKDGPDGETRDLVTAFNKAGAPSKFNLFDEKVATQFYTDVRKIDLQNQKEDQDPPLMAPGDPALNVIYNGKTIVMDAAKASQVDFIERTLIGEVMDCEEEGLGQAEAVGVVIARRLMAVSNAAREQKEVEAKNEAINQENNKVLERSDLKGDFIKNTEARLRGRRDFGRPPPPFPTSLPFMAGAEVVSRNLQFSVWQPNVKKFYNTSTDVHNANIPNYRYPIFGALPENDLRDQIRGLCPEIPKNTKNGTKVNVGGENLWKETFSNSQVWSHISDLALQIVNDPEAYLKRYTLKPPAAPKDHVYFYTHGPDLPFAVETHVDVIHDNVTNKDLPLRKKVVTNPYDPCNKFRTFAPKDVGEYENKSR